MNLIYSGLPSRAEPEWLIWTLYAAGAMLTWAATIWIASERYLGRQVNVVDGMQLAAHRLPILTLSLMAALATVLSTALSVLPGILVVGTLSVGIPVIMLESRPRRHSPTARSRTSPTICA